MPMEESVLVSYKGVELHRKELIVLKDIDLEVKAGEFLYIIGKVGSGKSSLMKSMYADIPIIKGDADVLGYDLTAIKRKDVPMLRREIGIVFQDFQLLTETAAEGTAVIMATHNLALVEQFPARLLRCHDKRITSF